MKFDEKKIESGDLLAVELSMIAFRKELLVLRGLVEVGGVSDWRDTQQYRKSRKAYRQLHSICSDVFRRAQRVKNVVSDITDEPVLSGDKLEGLG